MDAAKEMSVSKRVTVDWFNFFFSMRNLQTVSVMSNANNYSLQKQSVQSVVLFVPSIVRIIYDVHLLELGYQIRKTEICPIPVVMQTNNS